MTITHLVLKPLVDRLFFEYKLLDQEISFFNSPSAGEFKKYVRENISHLEALVKNEMTQDRMLSESQVNQLRETIRKLKLDLRTLQRRWNRFQVTEERFQRLQENKNITPRSVV